MEVNRESKIIGRGFMKLVKMSLKDFRGYGRLEVEFHPKMNVIIGKNDVGKSTIMDAMNIFFNEDIKAEIIDCNTKSVDMKMEIGASFELDDDELIIIDASNPTSLKEEYLLNDKGHLEIIKVINASGKSITQKSTSVYIQARHPKLKEQPLITYKQEDLKKLLNEYKDEIENHSEVNKSKKADMRKALFSHLINEDTIFENKLINILDIQDESLKTWDKLKANLPLFTLFQSDRSNTDGDKEVQDPMKAITKQVLSDLQTELDNIRDEVVRKVEQIGEGTIEKLKEFNSEIASQLKTIPELKSWDSLFKFSLDTDDNIPLNKRGSGVRRLILLSYFRDQAEKSARQKGKKQIIYAIEEPETSQHPDYQSMIIDSLTKISEQDNHQVFITTHTPEIARMVDKDSLILVKKDSEGNPQVVVNEELKLREISSTLGILPNVHSKLVICVEGPNDIKFLQNINKSVSELREIIDIERSDISICDLGGSRLINWINKDHFRNSNIKEYHLYDGDIPKYKAMIDKINSESDGRRSGSITKLREMENYIPINLIEEEFDCNLSKYRDSWKEFDLPKYLKDNCMKSIKDLDKREIVIKEIINNKLAKKLNYEGLQEHGVYDEIREWFETIKEMYSN